MAKSLRERLKKKREELASRSGGQGNLIFIKEGTIRVRVQPVGEDQDFGVEIPQFYLGSKIKGVISPSVLGGECPILEKQKELAASKDPDEQEIAKSLIPRNRHLMPVIMYKDERGKEIDEENSGKFLLLTNSLMSQIIDFYLDPDLGDFTDPENGYDLKITRRGSGKLDTEYSVRSMPPSKVPAKWAKEVDLQGMLKAVIPSYEEAEAKLEEFLGGSFEEEENEPKAKVRKKKTRKVSK
jgi:hypothetical protein